MMYKAPRGTVDILPEKSAKWQTLEQLIRTICANYNVKEVRTPIFEHTELFTRAVGDTTDVVSKEMYTFADKKGRSITLRPEGTAGVARAYVENKMFSNPDKISKLYYICLLYTSIAIFNISLICKLLTILCLLKVVI